MTEVLSAGRVSGSLNALKVPVAQSFAHLIVDRVKKSGPAEAYRGPDGKGGWLSYTWDQTYEDASEAAAGLMALGVEAEERVAIASNTRVEWIFADYAIMLAGAATTTVYPSTGEEDVEYILSDSGTKVLIAEDAGQAAKAQASADRLPRLEYIVLIDGEGDGKKVLSWAELRAKGRALLAKDPKAVDTRVAGITSDCLATLMYTSGTTGKPKGVELTHGNWAYESAAMASVTEGDQPALRPDDVWFLWLPLSHSFGKVLLGGQLQVGGINVVDGNVPKIVENLPIIQPTLMAAVPRIFEKVHAGVIRQATEGGGAKAKIFAWAFNVGERARVKRENGENIGPIMSAQLGIADKLVFSKVRERLGGRMRYFISGSAALSSDINKWFQVVGLTILEGYGLTETSAATTVNWPDTLRAGTVGVPMPGTEIKIADDGEILIRGGGVMRAYRNRPEANEEVFLPATDGGPQWFATGDIGVIDDAGRVKITDRKKDLVKTSGGKYIAPGQLEAQFKALCPLAGAVVIIANDRNFASALVGLDPDAAKLWAESNGKSATDVSSVAGDPDLKAEIQAAVDELNTRVNKWETIKQFRVIPRELTIDEGFLTPSLKVKRKVVETEFKNLIDDIYSKVQK